MYYGMQKKTLFSLLLDRLVEIKESLFIGQKVVGSSLVTAKLLKALRTYAEGLWN